MAQQLPFMPIPIGGVMIAATIFFFVIIMIVVGMFILRLKAAPKAGVYALIIDPRKRRIELEPLEEVATNVYRAKNSGDMIVVPEDAISYSYRGVEVYPAVRIGRRLAHIDPGDVSIAVGIDGIEYKPADIAELIALLYSKGKLSGGFRVSPSMSLSIYVDAASMAKRLAEIADATIEDAIIGIANMTGSRREFEELVENIMRLERAKAETFERRAFTIMAVIAGIMLVAAIVLAILYR